MLLLSALAVAALVPASGFQLPAVAPRVATRARAGPAAAAPDVAADMELLNFAAVGKEADPTAVYVTWATALLPRRLHAGLDSRLTLIPPRPPTHASPGPLLTA